MKKAKSKKQKAKSTKQVEKMLESWKVDLDLDLRHENANLQLIYTIIHIRMCNVVQ